MSQAVVVGGGPAGLMAAEVLAEAGIAVTLADRMPSLGRRLLMAGRGGLNLTHAEPLERFLTRYTPAEPRLLAAIRAFPPEALMRWAEALGQPVFTGSSGRVFPRAMKASPLLRAWLRRLAERDVTTRTGWHWTGWGATGPTFATPAGVAAPPADVTVLALGGASWPRLGADGSWTACFPDQVSPLRPANCGFLVPWSEHLRARMAGQPLKRIRVSFGDRTVPGEAMITATGIEGGVIYALSAALRDAIAAQGQAVLRIDLRPDLDHATIGRRLDGPSRGRSLSALLRQRIGLSPAAVALVQEARHAGAAPDLPTLVKALPLTLTGTAPIGRSISTAGGLRWDAIDDRFMLRDRPGVFLAGEMLDWEAPTGGYLLQACLATGRSAALGACAWLRERPAP